MNEEKLLRLSGFACLLTAILLPSWWVSLGLFLPVKETSENFDLIVIHPNWIPVNIIGLLGTIVWAFSLLGLNLYQWKDSRIFGFIGFVLAEVGIILYACIQYYETFIWPVVAQYNPTLVKFDGALVFGDAVILIPLIISGVILAIGHVLLGIDLLRRRVFPSFIVLMLIIGAVVFGNGVVFSIRTVGIVFFTIAMLYIGSKIYKSNKAFEGDT